MQTSATVIDLAAYRKARAPQAQTATVSFVPCMAVFYPMWGMMAFVVIPASA